MMGRIALRRTWFILIIAMPFLLAIIVTIAEEGLFLAYSERYHQPFSPLYGMDFSLDFIVECLMTAAYALIVTLLSLHLCIPIAAFQVWAMRHLLGIGGE